MLITRPLLDRLATAGTHPGRLLHYFPDQLSREPIAADGCAPTPTAVARSPWRYTLSSERQIQWLSVATADLNGQLLQSSAETIVGRARSAKAIDPLPRELVLELTTRRLSTPIFSPLSAGAIDRNDLSLDAARRAIDQLAQLDDARLTLAGVGDPLLHADVLAIIAHAAAAGVAVNLETDLIANDDGLIESLAVCGLDVLSIHLPAISAEVYASVMGLDAYMQALRNLQLFVARRAAAGRGAPLVAPMFTKLAANLHEMEAWYDQWLRAVGTAVIVGPSTFGGHIADVAAADMTPPRRGPCRRLSDRLTVLSDGRYSSCEQDVLGRQCQGHIQRDALGPIWRQNFAALRIQHADGRWKDSPVCARCDAWHRP